MISIRIDDALKKQAETLFDELGMTLSGAFMVFVKQALRQRGLPFPVTVATDPFYNPANIRLIEQSRESALNSVYATFARNCRGDECLMYGSEFFERAASQAFAQLVRGKPKLPQIIRLAGQSGSGKTTQLLPAICARPDANKYVHIAVRVFAQYHPYYEEIKKTYGEKEVRERTNGFALLLLFRVVELLIENGYGVLFEMTLLDPDFEVYLTHLAKMHGYGILYNVMAVPHSFSDALISVRKKKDGRIVYKETSDYFYNILPQSLARFEAEAALFDSRDLFILWSADAPEPLRVTHSCDAEFVSLFSKERKRTDLKPGNEEELRSAKTRFFKKLSIGF